MKLEVRHITPYLPYNLKILVDGIVCDVEGIDLCQKDTLIAERVDYKFENIKLILRPLSQLTKEIRVNGEKFTPINRLSERCRMHYEIWGFQNTNDLKVVDYLQLIKNLFDIDGLIEKGLAMSYDDAYAIHNKTLEL